MKILSALIFIGLILLGVCTLANWSVLSTPTALSFLVFTLEAPLSLVLLGSTLVFISLFTVYVLILRMTMLIDARRYSRQLEELHQLAEKSEASRLGELRSQIDRGIARLREAVEQSCTDLSARVEGMEQALRNSIEESTHGLSAYIGEVEDKLDRNLVRSISEK